MGQPGASDGGAAPSDVFISYKRNLRPKVEVLADLLRALKLKVWFDASLEAGTSFGAEINREVKSARCVMVCWSPNAFASGGDVNGWVVAEATIGRNRARAGQGGYAPILLEPTDLDAPFNTDHVDNLVDWFRKSPDGAFAPGDMLDDRWLDALKVIGVAVGRPGLADYVRARMDGLPSTLIAWLQRHPTDPLADEGWAEVEAIELARTRARLVEQRRNLGAAPLPEPQAEPPWRRSGPPPASPPPPSPPVGSSPPPRPTPNPPPPPRQPASAKAASAPSGRRTGDPPEPTGRAIVLAVVGALLVLVLLSMVAVATSGGGANEPTTTTSAADPTAADNSMASASDTNTAISTDANAAMAAPAVAPDTANAKQ